MRKVFDNKYAYFMLMYMCCIIYFICVLLDQDIAGCIFKVLTILLFAPFLLRINDSKNVDFEKWLIATVSTLFIVGIGLSNRWGEHKKLNIVCGIIVCFITLVYFYINYKKIQFKAWFKNNYIIILVIFAFILLSIEVVDSWLMWDSRVYYSFPYGSGNISDMMETFNADFTNIKNMYFGGHTAIGYALYIAFFCTFYNSVETVQVADIILACISIYAFYQIVRIIFDNKYSNTIAALATIPYALSPFILGIVGNVNLDSANTYFMVICIACFLYKYDCLGMIMAALCCLTKETAVLYYATYIVTKILFEYDRDDCFISFLKFELKNVRNYQYILPTILWLIFFLLSPDGVWGSSGENGTLLWNSSGLNCFGINTHIITSKLKQIFLVNFNWFFWGTILICKRCWRKKVANIIIPIMTILIPIILFGCLFITTTHIRYIGPLIPILYLGAIATIEAYGKKILCGWSFFISIFLFIQSYYTIDPVMYAAFPYMSVGSRNIFSMHASNSMAFHDSIVYNRQYMYWSDIVQQALKESNYDGEMLIVLPGDLNCTRYNIFGDHETLWDVQNKKMNYYFKGKEVTESELFMQVCGISEITEKDVSKKILYLIPQWGTIDMEFLENYKILQESIIEYHGYLLQYMVLEYS